MGEGEHSSPVLCCMDVLPLLLAVDSPSLSRLVPRSAPLIPGSCLALSERKKRDAFCSSCVNNLVVNRVSLGKVVSVGEL